MSEATGAADLQELRADIRHWRRGRADATLGQVLEDAYVAVFSALVVGAMVVNVVVGLRRELGVGCAGAACDAGRDLLPWLVALSSVLVVLSLARLFGPVFVTPAVGSWLLTTPLDRAALLRRRLLVSAAASLVVVPVVLAAATLGGLPAPALVAMTLGATLLAVATVAGAALSQERAGRGGALLTASLELVLWLLVLALATGRSPTSSVLPQPLWWPVVGVLGVLAVGLGVGALRGLPRVRYRQATAGGALAPGVSGALASLDLALVHDLVLAHRWRAVEAVRSVRRGPSGTGALVWPDVVRLRRAPERVLVLAATVVVPYAATRIGAGRLTVLVAVLAGFLACLPLLSALRVMTRTPALVRMLPFPVATARGATIVVPGVLLLLWALAVSPGLHDALDEPWSASLLASVAVAAAALAAGARWVTGRPPDYSRPLVSSPAGAVPTNLYASAFRGFDVALLGVTPLLLSPDATGALISLGLSAGVLSYLLGRR